MVNFRVFPFVPALIALAIPLMIPTPARACGGTFCDAGPAVPMPVDQTGENILFHIGDNSVEAHIQIQIDPETPAEQFAWVIPVTALPTFSVGSQPLFAAMMAGTAPRYFQSFTADVCGPVDGFDFGDEGGDDGGSGLTGGEGGDDGGTDVPEVVFQDTVGAFEIAVLDGGTVEGVMTWLGDNGYQQDPNAEPILAHYLDNEFLFVALKLAVEAGVDEVHPIVIRYEGVEPCVPIRLTQIAAVEDMDIGVFFLGDARVVPTNYRHVLVNPLKIDWFSNAANYKEVVTLAVDSPEADGNAFVTEYAGTSDVIDLSQVYDPSWSSAFYAGLVDSPVGAIERLQADGLFFCDLDFNFVCLSLHPLLGPLLAEYIPVPAGVSFNEFYDCLSCYAEDIDLVAWDAAAFAAKLEQRIFAPGLNASLLVAANPYLTRMYTTISPSEMNTDPMFRSNSTLPEVPAVHIANQRILCDGSRLVTLPDGREVFFPAGDPLVWPDFQDEMPFAEEVDQETAAQDAPLVNLVNNTEEINRLLDEHNKVRGYDKHSVPGCGACSTTDTPLGGVGFGLASLALFGFVRRRRS